MKHKRLFSTLLATLSALSLAGYFVNASAKDAKSSPEPKLPPGWTAEDMQACMLAGTPGKMHEHLAKDVGEWEGRCTMWPGPDGEPMTSECTSSVTSVLDGRFIKIEMKGEMPGMGPFQGGGISGYDNVTKKFVSSWIDNQSTGIMQGEGALSPDGKTLTWECTFNCPLTKKPAVMKQVETYTGADTKKLEMWGDDPKTGKNFKMMTIELTRK